MAKLIYEIDDDLAQAVDKYVRDALGILVRERAERALLAANRSTIEAQVAAATAPPLAGDAAAEAMGYTAAGSSGDDGAPGKPSAVS